MQSDMAIDHMKHAASAQLERSPGRLRVAIRTDKRGVCLPFQNSPVMVALDQRIRLFFPRRKRTEKFREMFGDGLLAIQEFSPGVKKLGLG